MPRGLFVDAEPLSQIGVERTENPVNLVERGFQIFRLRRQQDGSHVPRRIGPEQLRHGAPVTIRDFVVLEHCGERDADPYA